MVRMSTPSENFVSIADQLATANTSIAPLPNEFHRKRGKHGRLVYGADCLETVQKPWIFCPFAAKPLSLGWTDGPGPPSPKSLI